MAAVQPAQVGASQNSSNNAANLGLPPGMTRESVQALWQKFQLMRRNGVPESDPELSQIKQTLTHIQQRTELLRRQQAWRQQQQQQQKSAAQQNDATPPAQSNPADGESQATGQAATANGAMHHAATPPVPIPPSSAQSTTDAAGETSLTKEQTAIVRAQLHAFNLLQRNMPIPAQVQATLFASRENKPPTPADTTALAGKVLNDSVKAMSRDGASSTGPNITAIHRFETFVDPHSLYARTIAFADHNHRPYLLNIPSIMPLGVDVERVREERENAVYNRVLARRNELAALKANIGGWDSSKSNEPDDNANVKLRTLIEFKSLGLLQKQRELRLKVAREMVQADSLSMTANRSQYRRVKRQSLREARITEKLEKQQRDAAESKEKKKQNEHVASIIQHAEDIRGAAVQRKQRGQKIGRLVASAHSAIEREEQKRVERTAKQRLQALKANDEETYLKLLGQAKDSRISHLLKQTDGFLQQLSSSVKAQQRNMKQRYGGADNAESDADERDSDDESRPKVDYYEVAHRIKEEVHEQSSNLVGGVLKEYQLKGLQWMLSLYNNNLNGILADEMGLGKTIQTISLITYLIEKKRQNGPFLVIVPLSTLTNWNNEFEKWAPTVQRMVYKGPPNQRKAQAQQIRYNGPPMVLLTTYEFIIKDRPVLSKIKWVYMIVDEGHRMKNAGSKLSSTITQYYHTRYRLILTGTPLQNNLPELWALLNFVLPNIFKSVKSFDEWFNTPFANTGTQDTMSLSEEEQLLVIRRLHKVLRPFLLRRLKKDVEKDLPDKQERVVKCNFSALQAKLYKQLVTHNRIMVNDGTGKKTGMRGLSNMLMQLRKLCNHPFVFEEVEDQMNPTHVTNDLIWRTAGKFELLDRILPKLRATGHRVLMFFQMTQIMNIMEDFLRLREISYLRLDGATKADDRSELLKQFNAPDSPHFCFLLSTRAGGLGLNLQTADTVIIYDSDWNPHQDLQAQDRAHRIGQKNEVRILRLISSNSVEEKILERAQFKLDMDGKVIQAGKFDNKSTNEERDEMLRVMLESAEAADSLDQDEMDDDDLNLIMMRNDEELEIFQRLDRERAETQPYGPDKKLPRLLGESELPDIYLHEDNPVVEEIEYNYGRGARERAKVKYDDGLTEEQWLDAVDADDDTVEDAMKRKQDRVARRAARKDARLRGEFSLGESPPGSRVSSESPAPRKRGRKPGRQADKRKADDVLEAEPPKKRGRQVKVTETLSKEERDRLQRILDTVHDWLQDLEEQSMDPAVPNRGIIDPFLELPPKSQYPDYYQLIKTPIAMKQIENKINRKQYQSLRQFRQDIALLCNNCRQYNEDGSILYQDANLIESECVKKLREETRDYPELQDFDGMGNFKIKLNGPREDEMSD